MKPIETPETLGLFEILVSRRNGEPPRVFDTVTGENMAKLLVDAHNKIDVPTSYYDGRIWSYRPKATPETVLLCGHTNGVDCGSGQTNVNDFATDSEDEAKRHVDKYKGSWSQSGWYVKMPFVKAK